MVQTAWNDNIQDSPMIILSSKLKKVKIALRSWNKETFRDIFQKLKIAEQNMEEAESILQANNLGEASINFILLKILFNVNWQ